MGLLDNSNPWVHKGLAATVLVAVSAICVAMCAAPPKTPVLGDYGDPNLANINSGDCAWMLTSTALVLLMTPGVSFFYGGMMQHKNVVATIVLGMMPMATIPLMWSFIGFSLAFGEDAGYPGFIGNPAAYGLMYNVGATPDPNLAGTIPVALYFLFQLVFAVITPAIIIGAVADRVNFGSMCLFTCLWHLVVYCPIAHMVWHPQGIIHRYGVMDFAGGTVVHMSSGYAAIMAAWFLGPSRTAGMQSSGPANVPYVILGTAMLWFGWFGFNAGSALTAGPGAVQAFLCTNTATASAMLAWMLMDQLKGHKFKATGLCLGAVVGLVAITPAAGFVNVGAAALIGIIGAVMSSIAQTLMAKYGKKYVDDTLDVFACHAVGGTTGMICTSLFATTTAGAAVDGAFYGNGKELGKCLLVLIIIIPWFLLGTLICLFVTDGLFRLRVTDEEEMEGLDVSKHGEMAFAAIGAKPYMGTYPDAQIRVAVQQPAVVA